jgi:hypothetical protein
VEGDAEVEEVGVEVEVESESFWDGVVVTLRFNGDVAASACG